MRDPASTIVTGRGPLRRCGRRGSARSRRADVASPRARCAAAGGRVIASSRSRVSIRCAPRFVGAIAWISSMITYSTRAQRLACARREHQVERLGRGDQDVGRRAHERLAFLAGRVAGAHRRRVGASQRDAEAFGGERDAGERRAQVLLDVDGERAQRRDVEHAAAVGLRRLGCRSRAGRSPRGTRRASCPSRSGRGSACGRRPRSPASPGPARPWARRSSSRTRPGRAPRSAPSPPRPRYRRLLTGECQELRWNCAIVNGRSSVSVEASGERVALAVDERAMDPLALEVLRDHALALGDRVGSAR